MAAFRGERDLVGRDDMVTLSNLTEAELVANLKKRYTSGIIYVCIHLRPIFHKKMPLSFTFSIHSK